MDKLRKSRAGLIKMTYKRPRHEENPRRKIVSSVASNNVNVQVLHPQAYTPIYTPQNRGAVVLSGSNDPHLDSLPSSVPASSQNFSRGGYILRWGDAARWEFELKFDGR